MTITVVFTPSNQTPKGIKWSLYLYNDAAGIYQNVGTTTTPQPITSYLPESTNIKIRYQTVFGACSPQTFTASVVAFGVNVINVQPASTTASCLGLPKYYNVTVQTGNTVQYALPVTNKPFSYSLNTSVTISLTGTVRTITSGGSIVFKDVPAGTQTLEYYYNMAAPSYINIDVSGDTTVNVYPNAAPYMLTLGNTITYQGNTTSTPYPVTVTGLMNGQKFSGTITSENSYFFSPIASGKNVATFGFAPSASVLPTSICTYTQNLPNAVSVSNNAAYGTEVFLGMPYSCAVNFPTFVPPTNITLNIAPNAAIPDGTGYTVTFPSPISQSTSATAPNVATITFPASQLPSNDTLDFTFQYSGCSSASKGSGTITTGAGVYPLDLPFLSCASSGSPPTPPAPSVNYLYYLIAGLVVAGGAIGGVAYLKGRTESVGTSKLLSLIHKGGEQ